MNIDSLEIDKIIDTMKAYVKTSMGENELSQISLFSSKLALKRELNRVNEALQLVVKYSSPSFYGLSDVSAYCEHAVKQGILSIEELVKIARHLHGLRSLKLTYQKSEIKMEYLLDLFDALPVYSDLAQKIDTCFSSDYEVYDTASESLFKIRKQLQSLESRVSTAISSFIQKNSSYLSESFSTIRQDRTVLPVITSEKNRFKGIIHDQSASGQTTYVEPQFLIDLNNERQSLLIDEHQEIVRICRQLSFKVGDIGNEIMASVQSVGLLDALFSKAVWAKDRNGVVASLSDNELLLKQARHPLLDLESVVANTYRIVPPHRMILITGPNTGGKTVGLKTVGTSVYLTLSGCPVLCDEAIVPQFDQLFVDIGDQQSLQQSLSTFSGHLTNLKEVLDKATERSLVLLDELGSGTDPIEGESLAQSILEYLTQCGCMGVITTHFNRLKVFAKKHDSILSSSVQFDLDDLRPTYRYIEGLAGQSYALDIARKLSVKQSVVDRALTIKQETLSEQEILIDKLEKEIAQTQFLNETLRNKELEFEKNKREIAILKNEIESSKEKIIKEFENKQNLEMKKIVSKAKTILAQMREQEKLHESIESVKSLEELVSVKIEDEDLPDDREVVVGDTVRVLNTQQVGTVVALGKKEATLDVRGLRMIVKINQLVLHKAETVKKEKRKQQVSSVSLQTSTPFQLEVNLIGLRVEEAMIELASYLDMAVVNKMKEGRVIHGHGTGALRQATHEVLKRNSHVKSFRLGGENEGGVGATVVEFK